MYMAPCLFLTPVQGDWWEGGERLVLSHSEYENTCYHNNGHDIVI